MGTACLYFPMGLFNKKKKAKVVEKTPIQKLNEEIKINTNTVTSLERLKPRLNKFITHYKRQLHSDSHVYGTGVTLHFSKGIVTYPDGFYAFADKLGLNIEPICGSTYNYSPEPSFIVRAKSN